MNGKAMDFCAVVVQPAPPQVTLEVTGVLSGEKIMQAIGCPLVGADWDWDVESKTWSVTLRFGDRTVCCHGGE